ncbi:MAG: pyridoxamine 5'-phosphate oxidase family protein [Desulfobacteraceae bacterium]|nr:pyridoxamine 5'-phosphate oxidase family protein [Desulfobacteraceae bacterium]
MRRKDKEITEIKEIEEIINKAKVFRLALSFEDTPYVVPLNFGYQDKTIYFHCAKKGKKVDILKQNNKVCFEFDTDNELVKAEKACKWGMNFKSVIGFGKADLIENPEEKQKALAIIMRQYTAKQYEFPEKQLNNTLVWKIDILQITGKKSGY